MCVTVKENMCFKYDEIKNMLTKAIELPQELKSAKFIESNRKLISGITTDGQLFSWNPVKGYSKTLGKVARFASSTAGLCAITGENELLCYGPNLKPKNLHAELKDKV